MDVPLASNKVLLLAKRYKNGEITKQELVSELSIIAKEKREREAGCGSSFREPISSANKETLKISASGYAGSNLIRGTNKMKMLEEENQLSFGRGKDGTLTRKEEKPIIEEEKSNTINSKLQGGTNSTLEEKETAQRKPQELFGSSRQTEQSYSDQESRSQPKLSPIVPDVKLTSTTQAAKSSEPWTRTEHFNDKYKEKIVEERWKKQQDSTKNSVYSEARKRKQPSITERLQAANERLQELERRKKQIEDREFKATCTFAPQVNRRSLSAKPRYLEPRKIKHPEMPTFHPTTNKISKNMISTQFYLDQNPFEGLSRASTPQNLRTAEDSRSSTKKPAVDFNSDNESESLSIVSRRSSLGNQRLSKSFQNFIQRQDDHIVKKELNRSLRAEAQKPSHPSLCFRSLRLAQGMGDFFDRLEHDLEERSAKRQSLQAQKDQNDNYFPYKPQILANSKILRRRSWSEMSTGDQMKRDAIQSAAKQKAWQDELKDVTFKPTLKIKPGIESRLKITSEPETYLQRLERERQMKDSELLLHSYRREMNELAECTFAPKVRDAPEYVKRIARSIALTKKPSPPPAPT